MQAIPTTYKGYRFRSRVEARWAVFLDALNADWTYESEGFDLDGTKYLPDFWVRDWDCWIEVKGAAASPEELQKCRLLADASKKRVLLLSGEPGMHKDKNSYKITMFASDDTDREVTDGWEFGEGRRCSREIWLVSEEWGAFTLKPVAHDRDDGYPLSGSSAYAIGTALAAARAARFEFGQSGTA